MVAKTKITEGIYVDVPFDEYMSWDAVNNSILWELREKSPLHAKYKMENPEPETPAKRLGRALHTLILEPRKFNNKYAILPPCNRTTKKGKAFYEEFLGKTNGKEIIKQEDYEKIDLMGDAIRKQVMYRFIQQGEAEVCIVWRDKKTGLLCKARIDYLHRQRGFLIDLKGLDPNCPANASPRGFAVALYRYGYFQQAGFYSDGWRTLTKNNSCFVFLPVEKTPPFAVGAYEVNEQTLNAGRQSYRQALDTFAECLKTGKWPSYQETVELLDMPEWALRNLGISQYQEFPEE